MKGTSSATNTEKKKRLSGRLAIIIREFEAWAVKRRLKKLTERFTLTLTVTDGFTPDARPPKKEYKRCKPTDRTLGKNEWDAIRKAVRFSGTDILHALVDFFHARNNKQATGKEISVFLKRKDIKTGIFSPRDTSFLNALLRNACVPCRLLVAGRKWNRPPEETPYRFFVVET